MNHLSEPHLQPERAPVHLLCPLHAEFWIYFQPANSNNSPKNKQTSQYLEILNEKPICLFTCVPLITWKWRNVPKQAHPTLFCVPGNLSYPLCYLQNFCIYLYHIIVGAFLSSWTSTNDLIVSRFSKLLYFSIMLALLSLKKQSFVLFHHLSHITEITIFHYYRKSITCGLYSSANLNHNVS